MLSGSRLESLDSTHAHIEESFIRARTGAKMGADTWWVLLRSALAHMAAMLAAKSITIGSWACQPETEGCGVISVKKNNNNNKRIKKNTHNHMWFAHVFDSSIFFFFESPGPFFVRLTPGVISAFRRELSDLYNYFSSFQAGSVLVL